jgi:hypothetical protein
MIRFAVPAITILLSGCVGEQSNLSARPAYVCFATQSCANGTCDRSGIDFNLSTTGATGFEIGFVDSTFPLTFVETTSATTPDGPVALDTYTSADDNIRLTLARDGGAQIRARLQLSTDVVARDISATCTALPEVSQ